MAPYVKKLESSKIYKDFRIKYPDSFMAAAFFIIDLETGNNVHQIDFYLPKQKKFAAFSLDGGVQLKILESLGSKAPEKLALDTNIELEALPGILEDEMHNRGISEQVRKIIAVIQNVKGKKIWNLNCILTGMEILRSHIEDESQTVLRIEKTSFMEVMKKMPQMQQMPGAQVGQAATTKKDLQEEIKKLGDLQEELEKEKANLTKQVEKQSEKKAKAKK